MIAAPAIVRASKYWTPRLMAKEAEAKGRKSGQTTGTHIDNLVQCRKVITLSPSEAKKFSFPRGRSLAEKHNYVIKRSMPVARAWCDAGGQFHPACIVFFPKEFA
jgi:hypothetical protein